MGQTENVEKASKTSWFAGVKAEFSKIIWPEQKSVVRQTIAVVVVSVITGLIIALLDSGNSVFYAASSHLAALYCFMCSCGVMISKGLLSLSMANIMLHTLCETAPIATSLGFDSHFLR